MNIMRYDPAAIPRINKAIIANDFALGKKVTATHTSTIEIRLNTGASIECSFNLKSFMLSTNRLSLSPLF